MVGENAHDKGGHGNTRAHVYQAGVDKPQQVQGVSWVDRKGSNRSGDSRARDRARALRFALPARGAGEGKVLARGEGNVDGKLEGAPRSEGSAGVGGRRLWHHCG